MRSLLFLLALALPAFAADTLHIFTWADYISPETVEKFEKANKCKVVIDTFDSNESMYAKLKAGAKGYDLIFPTSYMIQLMVTEGLITELDHSKLTHLSNIDPAVLDKVSDKSMRHSVPYTLAYTVLACRSDKVSNPESSWSIFERPDVKQRMTLLDDMRESIGAALKSLGHSINTRDEAQLAAAQEVLLRWKAQAAKFDNEGYKAGLDSGEFTLVHGYSGDLWQVAQENKKITLIVPQEGTIMGCDEMVIPKSAPQAALAHAFINHLLDAEVAAENMQWTGYLCPNTAALKKVDPEFLSNPAVTMPEAIRAKSEVIQDLGADLAKYTKVWDAVKR
ncbi:polyamine ABC transporter substrate-binding protein [Brevifollis gellanilyticus]|uniref:Spermidine/putrescine ABC transporter substrate-binding protein n=1 Tax=Brevifollis gellanilyticus TaxID=748831 RepID=A0A512MDA5_9BACT|nr:spermidine/putrescine ABC transporter substrate-binding protein [Brevifollis gellanilyticus]GEP44682.1 spermidine/putrescine ABC transporter substrate-binding protein [Brevifollis gellanilyticus]